MFFFFFNGSKSRLVTQYYINAQILKVGWATLHQIGILRGVNWPLFEAEFFVEMMNFSFLGFILESRWDTRLGVSAPPLEKFF